MSERSRVDDGVAQSSRPRPRQEPPPRRASGPTAEAPRRRLDVERIIASVGEAAYDWDLRSDRIAWQGGAAALLGIADQRTIDTGASYHLLIATENAGARHLAIRDDRRADAGEGVPYRIAYRFLPEGRRGSTAIFVEDEGRWFAGANAEPAYARGVVRRIDGRRADDERLRHLSEHDALTGLFNASHLMQALGSAIEDGKATARPCAFLLVGIDNLARINETFGFDVGDSVIRAVGQRLARELRGGDIIGRLSANKIGIVLASGQTSAIQAIAKRLIRVARQSPIETPSCRIAATVSIGAVHIPRHADSAAEAIAAALEALGEAKLARQDRLVTFTPDATRLARRRENIEIAETIIGALDGQRMMMALQGIVRADTGEIASHECLLRMDKGDGTLVMPGDFVPIAEQLGLARLIDTRVLELAVALIRKDPALRLSFNVSGLTTHDHEWLIALHRLTGGDRRLTGRLTIEITETTAIADLDECAGFVDALQELGCRVAIDDFGAGFTSFQLLRHLGADVLKIDGSYVRNLAADKSSLAFIEAMVLIANSLGMETVAEWVGDSETAEILRRVGVTYLQGFHFSTPVLASLDAPPAADAPSR